MTLPTSRRLTQNDRFFATPYGVTWSQWVNRSDTVQSDYSTVYVFQYTNGRHPILCPWLWELCILSGWSTFICSATLLGRHNGRDGVSNRQPYDCLLSRLFRRRWRKTSNLRATGLCAGISPVTGDFPHKGPVTREMFPFDDTIMNTVMCEISCHTRQCDSENRVNHMTVQLYHRSFFFSPRLIERILTIWHVNFSINYSRKHNAFLNVKPQNAPGNTSMYCSRWNKTS